MATESFEMPSDTMSYTIVLQNTKSGLSITTAYKVHIRQNIFLSVQVQIHRESIKNLDPLKNDQANSSLFGKPKKLDIS